MKYFFSIYDIYEGVSRARTAYTSQKEGVWQGELSVTSVNNGNSYSSGYFGIGIDFDNNNAKFYANSTFLTQITPTAYPGVSLKYFDRISIIFYQINFSSVYIPYFRNEFHYIPDGYTVFGDYFSKKGIEDDADLLYGYQ